MKILRRVTAAGTKLAVLTAAVVLSTVALGGNANAGSSQPEIFFSTSSTAAIQAPAIIVNPGTVRDVYVWVKDANNSTGVSGFTLAVQYNDQYFTLYAQSGDYNGIGDKTWLSSTGRSGSCIPEQGTPEAGRIVGLCSTLQVPPPYGATGTGLLGHIKLNAGNQLNPASPLTLIPSAPNTIGTKLIDTPIDPENVQEIPVTLTNSNVVFIHCADNSSPAGPGIGDHIVDLPNDILGVVLRFQWNTSAPQWHDAYDVNGDGVIDLPNDILGTILQFQMVCVNDKAK